MDFLRFLRLSARWGFWGALVAVLWVGTLDVWPDPIGPYLDASFHHAFYYFHQHHLQAGRDYVFTYGPLGHFLFAYEHGFFPYKLLWETAVNLLFAVTAVAVLTRLPSRTAKVMFAIALLILCPSPHIGLKYEFTVLFLGLFAIRAERISLTSLAGVAAVFAAFSLAKFTLLVMSVAAIACLTVRLLANPPRWRAFLPGAAYGAALMITWLAAGQRLANLPAFVRSSLEISRGYTAMTTYGNAGSILLALIALACCGGAALTLLPRLLGSARDLAVLAILGIFTFLEWKHGFVRHDGHAHIFYSYLTLAALSAPAFLPAYDWYAPPRSVLLAYVLPLAVFGICVEYRERAPNSQPQDILADVRSFYRENIKCLRHLRRYVATQDAQAKNEIGQWQLPRTAEEIGSASVDLLGFEQGVMLANGFNWCPRPVFQSYTAYTPSLLQLNADFFRKPCSPEYVLFKLQSIDERLPILEDSLAVIEILRRYNPVFSERSYLLMKRRPTDSPATSPPPPFTVQHTFRLGEEFKLPDVPSTYVKAALRIHYTKLGKLSNALFKPPCIKLCLRTENGVSRTYRIVPEMARAGFLLNPLLESEADVVGLYSKAPGNRVASISVIGDGHVPWALRPDVRLTLEALPDLGAPLDKGVLAHLQYPMMPTLPIAVHPASNAWTCDYAGVPALGLHPDAEMSFPLRPGVREVTGRFGILPGAYEQYKTPGVKFVVEPMPERSERQLLFQRSLDPCARPADRGLQAFAVPLPPACAGRLVCRTTHLPGRGAEFGWAAWTGVKIE